MPEHTVLPVTGEEQLRAGHQNSAESPSSRVLSSASRIAANSRHVIVHPEAITKLAKLLATQSLAGNMGLARWKEHTLHPKTSDQAAVDWIFVADTLNFSFWSEVDPPDSKYAVDYMGQRYTGYWSCCAALNRALDENIPILEARYLAEITDDQVRHIFRTSTEGQLPMLPERRSNLREAGKVLLEKYGGTFVNCIRGAGSNSQELLRIILADFPSYRDSRFDAEFYKRAQILVADIWACFEGQGFGRFEDIDSLTIFADYRIPQVLNYFGTMTYNSSLQTKLGVNHMFEYGDEEEMDIRGCTIHVCELLKNELNGILQSSGLKRVSPVNAIVLDHYLWDYRQLHSEDMKDTPYHKVRCIFY